jgi:hypothetical protein
MSTIPPGGLGPDTVVYSIMGSITTGKITEYRLRDPLYSGQRASLKHDGGWMWWVSVGKDVFLTREEAVEAAEKVRLKKIASAKKQIARLEAMSFRGGK